VPALALQVCAVVSDAGAMAEQAEFVAAPFAAEAASVVTCDPLVWFTAVAAPVGSGSDAALTGWVTADPSTLSAPAVVSERALVWPFV